VHSASICLLLLIFIVSSTGISFYIHTCGSNQKKEVRIFREIFEQKIACCCDDNLNIPTKGSSETSLNDADCCRISHLFIKAPFLGFPILEKYSVPEFQVTHFLETALLKLQFIQESKASYIPFPDPSPPPLSGVILLHFLHQIRIPEPVC
jgi:hypothetical protein